MLTIYYRSSILVHMKSENELNELIEVFLSKNTKETMLDFLYGILTPKELMEISRRLQIVKMLKKGIAQHEIANSLQVGVATVTRGSKELQKGRFKNI